MAKANTFIKSIALFVFISIMGKTNAQMITGKVSTEEGISLNGAIVNIIHQKDSIFHSFGRTDEKGKFSLPAPLEKGTYLLVFVYPKHTDVAVPLRVDELFQGKELDAIKLPLNSIFLEEVTITAKGLMNIKGDTLEYNISSLKLAPNSRVEDVINQLPGMQITKGGQIFSHGKVIERVLVDGEPFFGNDPTLVTKNLRSDMVDKIQVYDDASKNEKITGIKDNNKMKTIDIKLKEDKKRGVFGMAQLGYLNRYYNNMFMLNRFNGKEKIFGYGVMSNTGKLGIGYKSMTSGGGSLGSDFDGNTGKFTGEGRPKVYSSGMSYSNDWEKYKLNTNVSVKGMTVKGDKEVYQVIDVKDQPRENTSTMDFKRTSHEQNFVLNFENKGSSKLYVSLNAGHERALEIDQKKSLMKYIGEAGVIKNIEQGNDSKEDIFQTNLNVNWSTKLKKEGRKIAIGFQPSLTTASKDTYIKITNNTQKQSTVSELKTEGDKHENNLDFSLSYSEPVFEGALISSVESKSHISGSRSNIESQEALYSHILEGDFKYNYMVKRFKSVYRRTIKGFTTEFGTALSLERSNLKDIAKGNITRKNFLFLQPTADLEYKFSQNHTIEGHYSKTNISPTSYLVQPFGDASDLLNIYTGNTELEPRSINSFSLNYHNFKLQKLRAINASFEYKLKYNDIGYSILTSEDRNTIKPINIEKSTYDYTFNSSYGKEVSNKKDYLWLQLEGKKSMSYSYVDKTENRLSNLSVKFTPTLTFKERAGIQFNLGTGPIFENLNYSQNEDLNFEGIGFQGNGDLNISFPLNFRLEQRFNYVYKPQNKLLGTTLNQLLWDISLIKNFGKENIFTAELSVNDLLNQNLGLQRVYGNTGFIESKYSTINRYFLLSFKWDLNRMGE
ncbi:TonB-dependent receptor [Sphingobacterium sp. MYb388]|uniref:TonB-dependent receptor n=1 Tax=Sphingobacterium sp. MYb388 TaxID=2745437 RepID=UPI0030B60699